MIRVSGTSLIHLFFSRLFAINYFIAAEVEFNVQMRLRVSVQYRSIASDPTYGAGLAKGGGIGAVPNTYFPMREGCRLVLYQDAHQATLFPSAPAIRKTDQPAELFISTV